MSKIYLPRRAVLAAVPALVAAPYIARAQGKLEKTKVCSPSAARRRSTTCR